MELGGSAVHTHKHTERPRALCTIAAAASKRERKIKTFEEGSASRALEYHHLLLARMAQ